MSVERLPNIGVSTHDLDCGFSLLRLSGYLDIRTAPRLHKALLALHDDGRYRLALNVDGVRFMDSAGLGVLVETRQRVRAQQGRMLLVCRCHRWRRLFTITGLMRMFEVFEDEGTLSRRLGSIA